MELKWNKKSRVSEHYKSDRKTEAAEIDETLRKNRKPSPTHYDPKDTYTKQRLSSGLISRDPRLGYIDEALLLGEQWPT